MEGQDTTARFRRVMGRFPTGVTVAATRDADGDPVGLTVSSFTSVSLDPPLVLVCIGRSSTSHDALLGAEGFAVSILSSRQADVAIRFASEPSDGRFDDFAWEVTALGNPVITGAAGWIDCLREEVIPGGDHTIILGRAGDLDVGTDPPMVFVEGSFGVTKT